MSGTRVFVGNLSWSVEAQDLQDHLAPVGGVLQAEILTRPDGRSKGFGVVTFDSEMSASRAIQEMVDTELNGRPIWLREYREEQKSNNDAPNSYVPRSAAPMGQQNSLPDSPPECNVHVGNLPWSTTSEQLRYLCDEFGELLHAEVTIGRDGRSRGYGLVIFQNADDAARCIEALHGSMFENRDLTVRISRPRAERFGGGGNGGNAPGFTVFVGNMPWSFNWQQLKDLAKEYGDVGFVDVGKDKQGRSRGV